VKLETKPIRVPDEVHSLLNEARKVDIMRPTLGQVVTKLAYEHYGHLAKTPSHEAAARPVAPQNPQNGAKSPYYKLPDIVQAVRFGRDEGITEETVHAWWDYNEGLGWKIKVYKWKETLRGFAKKRKAEQEAASQECNP